RRILRVGHVDPLRCQSHLVGTSIHPSSFILHHFRHPRFVPESRFFSRIAWPLGRCRPPTVLAMGQNRQKTGKTCLLPPSTSSGRIGPEGMRAKSNCPSPSRRQV